ncbi:uncharacterized protein MELLADRAFT_108880 [Melampsora larici-populina 98AG31]|uniref:Uncharacterized protein n=1 Tax=Melampsora larici-populina (strain 98AG31 / pathotype 3-4-7) TaxID=747676 RepID=F4RUL4_MELLP|nr:uncharacterized protein MELLADRAFT_108880 [Melampsora larici-populina 98AG31]EGG03951.1 hypothetical protein MELLADRAFT_108880 [Melampsora larici-populina 98AG31]
MTTTYSTSGTPLTPNEHGTTILNITLHPTKFLIRPAGNVLKAYPEKENMAETSKNISNVRTRRLTDPLPLSWDSAAAWCNQDNNSSGAHLERARTDVIFQAESRELQIGLTMAIQMALIHSKQTLIFLK